MNFIKKINLQSYLTIIIFALFIVVINVIEPRFLSVNNILNVFRQTSVNAIIAAGMTFVILTGGIDLSVGSIFALSATLGTMAMTNSQGFGVAFIITIAVGLVFGLTNGALVGYFKMQAFIVTLITMTFARGLTYIFSNGMPITMGQATAGIKSYTYVGSGYLLGIPVPVIIALLIYVVFYWLLSSTKLGRHIYAVGDNERSSILAGIKTERVKMYVYAICGVMASLAGLILTARLSSAPPTAGMGYELDAIAAVVLGGTSLSGGRGSIVKTLFGALIISVLANALNLLNVSSYYQMLVKAIVILLAIVSYKNK